MRAAAALSGSIVALLLTAGCAADAGNSLAEDSGADEGSVSPTPRTEPSTTEAPATGLPSFPAGTTRQSGKGTGRGLVLVDVRTTSTEGFDRVVLEFSGTGTPGWVVDYVDEPVLDGSGEDVAVDGQAFLDIYASGTTWPAPDYYDGPTSLQPKDAGTLAGVHVGGTFEGTTQVIAGIDGDPVPFRVFTRTSPSRLVVDVMDPGSDGD